MAGLRCKCCMPPIHRSMSQFVILLGGELTATSRLKQQTRHSRVLSADSGMRHAVTLGLHAEAWLGDFDSSDDELVRLHADVPRIEFPSDKPKTDGEHSIDEAISRGATSMLLVGALRGERSDHFVQLVTQMIVLAEKGIPCIASSGREEAYPLMPGEVTLDFPRGTVFSIVSLQDIGGLSIRGVRWPLNDHDVPYGSSLTMSNVVTDTLSINMKRGRAMIFANLKVE